MEQNIFRGKPVNEEDYFYFKKVCSYSDDYCKEGFFFGALVVNNDKYYICLNMNINMSGSLLKNKIGNVTATMVEVIPETVGKFTKITDKNGKKIFEGDIVTYNGVKENYNEEFSNCGEIKISMKNKITFSNRETIDMDDLYESDTIADCEIIGNIYEKH